MRETHFRPRLIDGEPVATTNVRSTHYVRRYLSKDEEEEPRSNRFGAKRRLPHSPSA